MNLQRVLGGSGLTKVELAELFAVSRQTLHHWANGHLPIEGGLPYRMAIVIVAALENAIDRRILPFGDMDRAVRRARVTRMAKMLQDLKPAPSK